MEINLFQILILLFIFYPLIKRFLDGMRPQEEQPAPEQEQADPWGQPAQDDPFSRTGRQGRRASEEESATYASRGQSSSQASGRSGAQTGSQTEPDGRKSSEPSWEDFFEGLESVLSGKEPGEQKRSSETYSSHRHPAHEPLGSGSGGSVRDSGYRTASQASSSARATSPSTRKQSSPSWRTDDIQDQSPVFRLDEDDPIHRTLDEVPEVAVIGTTKGRRIGHLLRDPERIRDGIVVREILGPPISRRPAHHRH